MLSLLHVAFGRLLNHNYVAFLHVLTAAHSSRTQQPDYRVSRSCLSVCVCVFQQTHSPAGLPPTFSFYCVLTARSKTGFWFDRQTLRLFSSGHHVIMTIPVAVGLFTSSAAGSKVTNSLYISAVLQS